MAAQTTRQPRTRKTAAKTEAPVLAAWPRFDEDAYLSLLKRIGEAKAMLGPVPRFWTQADLEALSRIDADTAELAADATDEIRAGHERAVAAVYAGRQIKGCEPLPLDSLAGCGDAGPRTATFTHPVTTIPVSDVRGAPPSGSRDEEMERHFAKFEAAYKEDPAGSASTDGDPLADPAEQDSGEEEHEPALDRIPDLRPDVAIVAGSVTIPARKPADGDGMA